MKKKVISVVIVLGLLFTGLSIVVLPQNTYSENENRVLNTIPSFSIHDVINGDYQEDLENALSDQFPLRNIFMELNTKIKLLFNKKDIDNTYIGKDNYYFEKVTNDDIDNNCYEKNLNRLEKLAEKYPNINFKSMLIPSSGIVLHNKLPAYASMYDYNNLINEEKNILKSYTIYDAYNELKSTEKQVYYRTDHHWTSLGAYIGYQVLMNHKGKYKEYNVTTFTNDFLGTLYSRVLDTNAIKDSIQLPVIDNNVTVKINGEDANMYDKDKIDVKDKYQVFFGGNYGIVEINGSGNGTLLILKDSFANSLVPYLTKDYKKIIMIDMRYYPGSLSTLLENEKIDDFLVLYEMNNFANDTNLTKILI